MPQTRLGRHPSTRPDRNFLTSAGPSLTLWLDRVLQTTAPVRAESTGIRLGRDWLFRLGRVSRPASSLACRVSHGTIPRINPSHRINSLSTSFDRCVPACGIPSTESGLGRIDPTDQGTAPSTLSGTGASPGGYRCIRPGQASRSRTITASILECSESGIRTDVYKYQCQLPQRIRTKDNVTRTRTEQRGYSTDRDASTGRTRPQ